MSVALATAHLGWWVLLAAASVPAPPTPTTGGRPTIQHRFAAKAQSFYGHLTGTLHLRNDYYDSGGGGADLGYYLSESLGIEVRGLYLHTRLNDAARRVKKETGFTPDAQPQQMVLMAGARYSLGYGKILLFDSFVVHFDPQLVAHAGVALAETHVLPTATAGVSLLTHYRWGLQLKLDLILSIQGEDRQRGWVRSLGFLPVLGLGWSHQQEGGA